MAGRWRAAVVAAGLAAGSAQGAPGANCTIAVDFTPGATGPRSALLTIPSDASNGPVTVGLDGVGALPGNGATTIPLLTPAALATLAAILLLVGMVAARRPRRAAAPDAIAADSHDPHLPCAKENPR